MVAAAFLAAVVLAGLGPDDAILKRGDVNRDNVVNVSDAIYLNSFLYSGGAAPPCMNQADVNRDGAVDVSDSVYLLSWLYSGGAAPPAPGPYNGSCTTTTPKISCLSGC